MKNIHIMMVLLTRKQKVIPEIDLVKFIEGFPLIPKDVFTSEGERHPHWFESKIVEEIGILKGALSHYETGGRMPIKCIDVTTKS